MAMEVFAHLSGSNLGFLCGVGWQDPAGDLAFVFEGVSAHLSDNGVQML